MQSASVAPWQQQHICFSHIPGLTLSHRRTNTISSLKCQTKDYSHTLSTEPTNNNNNNNNIINPYKKRVFLEQLYFSFDDPDSTNQTQVGKTVENQNGIEGQINPTQVGKTVENQKGIEGQINQTPVVKTVEKQKVIEGQINHTQVGKTVENQKGIEGQIEKQKEVTSSSMWWADLKAAVGQRINVEGIVGSVFVVARDRHLVMPHVSVKDIRHIDWVALKKSGFRGVVFDKDNTITAPYSLKLWPPLESSVGQCKSVFGNNIAVFSNSAGLSEFDPDGRKAKALERAIGIKVVRHRVKKPAGTAEEIEKLLGCASSELIMVGDRPFTDIVFGNRNGFLTILTGPLSLSEEPFIVKQVRKLEIAVVNLWFNRGLKPMSHWLLTDVQCVKDPRSL